MQGYYGRDEPQANEGDQLIGTPVPLAPGDEGRLGEHQAEYDEVEYEEGVSHLFLAGLMILRMIAPKRSSLGREVLSNERTIVVNDTIVLASGPFLYCGSSFGIHSFEIYE
jgi:hypothetical protein